MYIGRCATHNGCIQNKIGIKGKKQRTESSSKRLKTNAEQQSKNDKLGGFCIIESNRDTRLLILFIKFSYLCNQKIKSSTTAFHASVRHHHHSLRQRCIGNMRVSFLIWVFSQFDLYKCLKLKLCEMEQFSHFIWVALRLVRTVFSSFFCLWLVFVHYSDFLFYFVCRVLEFPFDFVKFAYNFELLIEWILMKCELYAQLHWTSHKFPSFC